jgi:hypothetical protein
MWLVDLIVVGVRLPEQTRLRKWVGPVETRWSGPVAPDDSHAWVGWWPCLGGRGGVGMTARVEFERARGLSRFKHTEANCPVPLEACRQGWLPAVAVIEGRALDDSR